MDLKNNCDDYEETNKKTHRQRTKWDKTVANDILEKGLVSTISQELAT